MSTRFTVLVVIASGLYASSPPPYGGAVDRVNAIAHCGVEPSKTRAVLQILERIALGRAGTLDEALGAECGVTGKELRSDLLNNPYARARAFREIGRLDRPEALTFLRSVKLADFDIEGQNFIWPDVQRSVQDYLLAHKSGAAVQTQYLEELLSHKDTQSDRLTRSWAIDQICGLGLFPAFSLARDAILQDEAEGRTEGELSLCEAKMNAFAGAPDRAQALGSFLSVADPPVDPRLVGWAIDELSLLHTEAADRVLEKAARRIEVLPQSERDRLHLGGPLFLIRGRRPAKE